MQTLRCQVSEGQLANEGQATAKETAERQLKSLGQQSAEPTARCEEQQSQASCANETKLTVAAESSELERRLLLLEERCAVAEASRDKALAEVELHRLQHEIDAKSLVTGGEQAKRLAAELHTARARCEEEGAAKAALQTLLNKVSALFVRCDPSVITHSVSAFLVFSSSKANVDLRQVKSRLDSEGLTKANEIDGVRRKLGHKLSQADEKFEEAWRRCAALEIAKQRLQAEVDDLLEEVEVANESAIAVERKQRQFERLVDDWKRRCEDFSLELEASQKEARHYSADLLKVSFVVESAFLSQLLGRALGSACRGLTNN